MTSQIIHLSSWAQTKIGTPIELYKKSHSSDSGNSGPILFIGGVHGDEPEGVRLAHDFIAYLQEQPEAFSNKSSDWLLIPCINPDGYSKNQRTNANGVDLNRNFPCPDWTTEAKAERYYPGPSPGSELEVQALMQLIADSRPSLIVHFHSWEPCIVYTGAPAKLAAEILANSCGYLAKEDIGYPTPGSLGQYGWLECKIPVICIEEQEHIEQDTIWSRFHQGLEELLKIWNLR